MEQPLPKIAQSAITDCSGERRTLKLPFFGIRTETEYLPEGIAQSFLVSDAAGNAVQFLGKMI
jgi:hypothetical protein